MPKERNHVQSQKSDQKYYNAKVPLQIAFIRGKTMKIITRLARKGERGNKDEIIP